jgi:hypothetical protein
MGRAQPDDVTERGLDRYRAYGRFYERYWSRLFSMTEADMARFAARMRAQQAALDLTTLARDVIGARLRHGPQVTSGPAADGGMPSEAVRLWDPTAAWRAGDRAIMAVSTAQAGRFYVPAVGEIRQVGDDHVIVQIDGILTPQVVALGMEGNAREGGGSYRSDQGQPLLADEILALADRPDESSQIDFVLWRFGESVVGRLLHALQADPGFVEHDGSWYSVDIVRKLREAQLITLTRLVFAGPDRPVTVDDVLRFLSPAGGGCDAVRFGALLSLQSRPDLFTNVGTESHPRWTLAGPPPVRLVAQHAVYDPETYVVLCTAGEKLSPQAAQRLWDAGLLRTALGPAGEAEATSEPQAEDRPGGTPYLPRTETPAPPSPQTPQRRSWRRWLPFRHRT